MNMTRRSTSVAPDAPPRITYEQIRQRAYELYLSRIREDVPGDPATDWLRAEQELRNRSR